MKTLEQASVRWVCWTFILLVAAVIRFVDLENLPAGLFRDEAEKGYNAYALATSGGAVEFPVSEGRAGPIRWRRWPAVIDVMGVKTSALYQYASVPFVRLFGLGVGSTRMAAGASSAASRWSMGVGGRRSRSSPTPQHHPNGNAPSPCCSTICGTIRSPCTACTRKDRTWW
ncbi:hypothetical protein IIC65_08625, partial [Candidatus Sumerlaeota bacterium]|nr:hypothetical protein [Candidatus Sumerlaeota bacterium]